eukprot:COSAG06_NODE_17911_length_914_cov_2.868712_1_plen_33_part_10
MVSVHDRPGWQLQRLALACALLQDGCDRSGQRG